MGGGGATPALPPPFTGYPLAFGGFKRNLSIIEWEEDSLRRVMLIIDEDLSLGGGSTYEG